VGLAGMRRRFDHRLRILRGQRGRAAWGFCRCRSDTRMATLGIRTLSRLVYRATLAKSYFQRLYQLSRCRQQCSASVDSTSRVARAVSELTNITSVYSAAFSISRTILQIGSQHVSEAVRHFSNAALNIYCVVRFGRVALAFAGRPCA
jgi:hypothetical protein